MEAMAFTFFFRDMSTLEGVQQYALPKLKTRRYLDVWDAGCATGPEPYTLAILIRENMGSFQFRNVRIFATDLNGQFGEIIEAGVYPEEQVKRIPPEYLERYFTPADQPGHYLLEESLRKSVRFQQHDLTSLKPIRDGLGLIVCKNVLLHLSPTERLDVLRMFHDALSAGGYLATEQTQKMPPEAQDMFRPVAGEGPVYVKV